MSDRVARAAVLHATEFRHGATTTIRPDLLDLVLTQSLGITAGVFSFRSAGVAPALTPLVVIGDLAAWLARTGRARVVLAVASVLGVALSNLIGRIRFDQAVNLLHLDWGANDPCP